MRLLIDYEALARQPRQEVGARAADRFNPQKFSAIPPMLLLDAVRQGSWLEDRLTTLTICLAAC